MVSGALVQWRPVSLFLDFVAFNGNAAMPGSIYRTASDTNIERFNRALSIV